MLGGLGGAKRRPNPQATGLLVLAGANTGRAGATGRIFKQTLGGLRDRKDAVK